LLTYLIFIKENERLKQLLDDAKPSLSERAKIRDLIKKGQDALEHEKLELKEKFDEKVLDEYHMIETQREENPSLPR
jgi:predicted  nucleic acid-binding Zn-ribbon protein